ncbi:MAG: TIGR04255 family protein [Gammaproteobacteria bacterium]|nr:TIGR04255 family protein [Gammaproteobacteria bacterium]
MGGEEDRLPDFERPPLVEVALSVQFKPLRSLHTPHFGLMWMELRNRFPSVEEHSPLNPVIETLGARGSSKASIKLEMVGTPPVPRVWFVNELGTELIQVQQDRFIHNWKKASDNEEYPCYPNVRKTFKDELEIFRAFIKKEGLGELEPNQCEVTYVNHIVSGVEWERFDQIGNVFKYWNGLDEEPNIDEAEDIRVQSRHLIKDANGEFAGRLHISLEPAFRAVDNSPLFLLKLTARGRPIGKGVDGVTTFLDLGRKRIVNGFAAITTEKMHNAWGRKDASK